MGNLTTHAECTSSWDRTSKLLATDGVQTAMLLNANPEQIQYALDHTTGIVVVRVYDPFSERARLGHEFEKDICLRHNIGDFAAWLNARDLSHFRGNKRVRFILGWNEQFYNGADYQRQQNKAMIDIATTMIFSGYGVAMHGLAADKTIQKADCESGVWDSTIKFLIENEEWAHLDVHEYEVGRLASQHLKTYPVPYPRSIEDPASMAQPNWGTIDYSGNTDNWHIGRIAWMLGRSRAKFGKDFKWARGEMGWDYKDDGSLRNYIPDYMGRYGKPQGLPSLRLLFNKLMGRTLTDIELCEEAYKDLAWFVSQDPESCLSNAIFADNPHSEHANFNIGKLAYEHLYTLLGQQNKPTPLPQPIPDEEHPMLVERLIKGKKGNVNIRPAASTTIIVIGSISTTYTKALVSDNYEQAATKDYKVTSAAWIEVEINGVKGFAVASLLDIVPIPPPAPTPKQYWLEINGATMIVNEAEYKAILRYQELSVAALKTILPE